MNMAAAPRSARAPPATAAIPSWAVFCEGSDVDPDEVAARDPVLVAYVERLGEAVRDLESDVGRAKEKQLLAEWRLTEFNSLLQGLQEEQLSRGGALERSSQAAAAGAQRALSTAVAVQQQLEKDEKLHGGMSEERSKRLEQRCEEHGRWLSELSAEVAGMARRGGGGLGDMGSKFHHPGQNGHSDDLQARISNLEQTQKAVAVGARRALHTALVVHQQQQSQDHDHQWEKCMDSLPMAEMEVQFTRRFADQDARLDKVIHMVDALADKVLSQDGPSAEGRSDSRSVRRLKDRMEAIEVSVREKVEEIEGNLVGLTREMGSGQLAVLGTAGPENLREVLGVTLESLEARMERSLHEVGFQLESLQDGREEQRLAMRQMAQQLPEVTHKLDQLWSQCQYYFPRVKEHDVHFNFFRTSFENHKQSWLDHADGLEVREHRVAAAAAAAGGGVSHWSGLESQPLSPSSRTPVLTTSSQLPPQQASYAQPPPLGTQQRRHGGGGAEPAPMGSMGSELLEAAAVAASADALSSSFDHQFKSDNIAPNAAGDRGGGGGGGTGPTHLAAESAAAAEEDAELGMRQRMLQQVMARLHGEGRAA